MKIITLSILLLLLNFNLSAQKTKLPVSVAYTVFEADKVLITVPVKVLQSDTINFVPSLPTDKTAAINSIEMGDGLKVFIEFSERFYPDILLFGGLVSALTSDNKTFYDAAFGKDSSKNILGFFAINEQVYQFSEQSHC